MIAVLRTNSVSRSRGRNALLAAILVAASGCSKKEAAKAPTPEVYVAAVVAKDVPVPIELVGQTRGSQDVEIRARVEGYLESVKFTEGTFVTKGTPLYQIDPKPFEATLAAAKADLANAQGAAPEVQQRRGPVRAARRAEGDQPAGAGQRPLRPGRGQGPGGRRDRGRGQGDPRPRLLLDRGAARRDRRHHEGQGRQPRRPRRKHAADDRVEGRPDPVPRRDQRGRVPSDREAGPGEQGEGREGRGLADPGRRHRSSRQGARRRDRAGGGRDDGHARGSVHVPEPEPPRAPRPVRARALRRRDEGGSAPRAAARRAGAAEPLQRGDRGRRRQGRLQERQGRSPRGRPLGDRGGPEGRGNGRRRGPAARPRGHDGDDEARGRDAGQPGSGGAGRRGEAGRRGAKAK